MDRGSQLDEDDADDKEDEEDEEDEEETRRRRRRRRRRRKEEEEEDEEAGRRQAEATNIKSNNPHLAGGEPETNKLQNYTYDPLENVFEIHDLAFFMDIAVETEGGVLHTFIE